MPCPALLARVEDFDLLGIDPPALNQVLARVLGDVPVWEGRDQRLIEDPGFLLPAGDDEMLRIDVVHTAALELAGLRQELFLFVIGRHLAGQPEHAAFERDRQVRTVDRVRRVNQAGQDCGPPGLDPTSVALGRLHPCHLFLFPWARFLECLELVERPALAGQAPQINNATPSLGTQAP